MPAELLTFALAFGAACLVGLVVLDRVARRPDFVVGGLFVARGFIPVAAGLVGAFIGAEELTGPEVWLGRLGTLVLILTIALGLLRPHPREAGRLLWLALVAHFATAALVEALTTGWIAREEIFIVLGLTALWVAPRVEPRTVARLAKGVLAAAVIGSTVAVVLRAPGAWVSIDGGGVIPGLDARLQGISDHPNGLGPLMVLYLLFERWQPSRRRVRLPLSVLAVAGLVLSQSKTAWVGAAIAVIVIWAADPGRDRNQRLAAAVTVLTLLGGLTLQAWWGNEALAADVADRFRTLTGRTALWQVGLDAWREQRITGAGLLFFETYAERTGQAWTGQAHNQFIQTLTEQGLVGLVTLLLYLAALGRSALRAAARSQATSLALLALLLARCITETPLSGLSFDHIALFSLLLAWEREAEEERDRVGRAHRGAALPTRTTIPVALARGSGYGQ